MTKRIRRGKAGPPPPERGNTRAVSHGATSARRVQELVDEYVPRIFELNPQLKPELHTGAVIRYAKQLARLALFYDHQEQLPHPLFADAKRRRTHPWLERLERAERGVASDERDLGIAPITRHRLGIERVSDKPELPEGQVRWNFTVLTGAQFRRFFDLFERASVDYAVWDFDRLTDDEWAEYRDLALIATGVEFDRPDGLVGQDEDGRAVVIDRDEWTPPAEPWVSQVPSWHRRWERRDGRIIEVDIRTGEPIRDTGGDTSGPKALPA